MGVTLEREGQTFDFILNAGPLRSGDKVLGCVVTLTDVTELKRAEEERSRIVLGLRRSKDAIFMTDPDGTITFVNPAFETLYGLAASEVIGRTPRILKAAVPEKDREFYRRFWDALLMQKVIDNEVVNQTKDGRQLQIAQSTNPVVDAGGKLVGFLAIQRDMTEAKRVEAALERSRQDFRDIIDHAADGIIIRRGREILYANPSFASRLGYAETAQLIGMDILTLVGSADHSAFLRQTGDTDKLEFVAVRLDGGHCTLDFSPSQAVDFDGSPADVTIIRDVTQRNSLQAQLLLSDRMASVGTLAAGVAHEINNPLAAMMANIELVLGEVSELTSQHLVASSRNLVEWSEMLSDARIATGRVRDIVRDLKIFSRSDEERRGPVDVHKMLDSTLRMAGNEIRHRAQLVKDYGRIAQVDASEARLGQVFLNLVVNAAQAIPEGNAECNEIRVVTRMEGDGQVIIEVRDTGPGMSPDVLKRLFTPFFTTKAIGEGTGLGLSICHRLVTGLGGQIAVESTLGHGSVFRVTLPVARAVSAPPSARMSFRPTDEAVARRGRILVIDDEPTVVRIVQRALSRQHEVFVAASASEAADSIRAGERFDVILCDLMMPDVSGMDLYDQLVRFAPEVAEKMVFMTGGAFTAKARAFLDTVPNVSLEKPFDLAALRRLVRDRVKPVAD